MKHRVVLDDNTV